MTQNDSTIQWSSKIYYMIQSESNPKQTFITFGVTQQIHTHDNPKYVPDRYMLF